MVRMVLSTILNKFGVQTAPRPAAAASPRPRAAPAAAVSLVYPPVDAGIPACDPEHIVQAASGRIDRLRELTVSDAANFDSAYVEPIRKLASLVHLLPASACDHYAAPAGLFNLCLDVAYFALQSADGKIFTPSGSVEQRHANEPRWRYATFLAALCCQVYRSLTELTVTNDQGQEWPRFTHALADWLEKTGSSRFYVNWHQPANVTGGEGAAMLSLIAPKERLDWLAQGDVQIVRDMTQVALGASHESDSIMARVVTSMVRRVLDVDKSTARSRYGRLTLGTHAEPYILDAFRHLVETGAWKINAGGPIWYGTDGLFIEWPGACADVQRVFEANKLVGMPRSSVTLAEMLGKAGVVIQAESGLWVRNALVPHEDGTPRPTTALRFVDAVAILGFLELPSATQPFGAELVMAERQAAAAAAPAPTAAPATPAPAPSLPAAPPQAPAPASVSAATSAPAAVVPEANVGAADNGEEVDFSKLLKPETRRFVSADIAEVLGQLLHLHGQHRGEIAKSIPSGVALSVDWVSEHTGADIIQFVRTLDKLKWLGRPQGTRNDAAKLHEVQFDDKVKQAIILDAQAAKNLGFTLAGRRS